MPIIFLCFKIMFYGLNWLFNRGDQAVMFSFSVNGTCNGTVIDFSNKLMAKKIYIYIIYL